MADSSQNVNAYCIPLDDIESPDGYRDRVHWLCRRAVGDRVLSIGCCRGVVPVLLAREGHRVVGIGSTDGDRDATRSALASEPPAVRERVRLDEVDPQEAHFEPASFDDIIVGDGLEGLVRPERWFEKLFDWLVEGGRLIVSVPLGFHSDKITRRVYYLARFLDLLSERFSVEEIAAPSGCYICGAAVKPASGEAPESPNPEQLSEWTIVCDRALEHTQRTMHHCRLSSRLGCEKLNSRLAESQGDSAEVERLHRQLDRERHKTETEKRRREAAERSVRYLQAHVETTQQILKVRMGEVRYRLGDAIVRASKPSKDTFLLPFRLIKLFLEGLAKRRARRAAGITDNEASLGLPKTPAMVRMKPPPRPLPEWLASLESNPRLEEPFSNAPTELIARPDLTIAGVMDEFSWRAWQYEANVFTFAPEDWRKRLEARRPDLLLVESTWRGVDESWHYQIRDLDQRPDMVTEYTLPLVIDWCKKHDVPTVFYNKEDPPNFEFFIRAAKLFDFVFTSDANCIPFYRERTGHKRVFSLPFAAQPRVHHPIETATRQGNVCFAGTWFNHRHRDRQQGAEAILRPALKHDLHIFDRMADNPSDNYRWPDIYQSCVYGALPYAKMVSAYKRFKVFLNINSVTDSPTMFARRVFELLASGTPVLSAESRGIREILGDDLVLIGNDEETSRGYLARLLGDEAYRERLSLQGQRKVFSEHTYGHRLATILSTIGLDAPPPARPTMTMIVAVEGKEQVDAACRNFHRQAYPETHLVLCTTDHTLEAYIRCASKGSAKIRPVSQEGAGWSALMVRALAECDPGWAAAMRPDDYYGPDYITDYANATQFLESPALGKQRFYSVQDGESPEKPCDGAGYRFVSHVNPWTLCLRVEEARRMAEEITGCNSAEAWWRQAVNMLGQIYASDPFNYVRHEAEAAKRVAAEAVSAGQADRQQRRLAAALA